MASQPGHPYEPGAAAQPSLTPEVLVRLQVDVTGLVQGVGFRPFVYRLAQQLGLAGSVCNTSGGALIVVEQRRETLEHFLHLLRSKRPPLCRIEGLECAWLPPEGLQGFSIVASEQAGVIAAQVLPDIATCDACLQEIQDIQSRRYRYPFTNCTNCGPRHSIMLRMPYDRPHTTMSGFTMCPECAAEYENPSDRRFHAQPIACPVCGPQLALWSPEGKELAVREEALSGAVALLLQGSIVAVKGVGGFLFLADAASGKAVERLRRRKKRGNKPFALMVADLEMARQICLSTPLEETLMASAEAPLVLLERRGGPTGIAEGVAPGMPRLAVMVPYTPLYHLLMENLERPLVATSGNLSEEPIAIDEHEAVRHLGGIAEAFLVHDRPIARPIDDSLLQVVNERPQMIRRARGYAPLPVARCQGGVTLLGMGAHEKNAVALAHQGHVFLGQHAGDLQNPQSFDMFVKVCADLQALYAAPVQAIAADPHPDYLSTRHAFTLGKPVLPVQHHYAHALSVMAEHRLEPPALGIVWDGTGYGEDSTVWGGEFLVLDAPSAGEPASRGFRRAGRLRPFRLPGGERCTVDTGRSALGVLHNACGGYLELLAEIEPVRRYNQKDLRVLARMIDHGFNAPWTTSMGRFIDAVAALLDICRHNSYSGEAAMLLEAAAAVRGPRRAYGFRLIHDEVCIELDWRPVVREILEELAAGRDRGSVAAAFHATLIEMACAVVQALGYETIVLSGGCFQNRLLLEGLTQRLQAAGRKVFWNEQVPPNDGGLALGQVWHALRHWSGAQPEKSDVSGSAR